MSSDNKCLVWLAAIGTIAVLLGCGLKEWQTTERLRIEASRPCQCAGDHSKCFCKGAEK